MRRDESGFTVLELCIAMMILFVIMTPLVTSFALGVRTTTESRQDATNSGDAQIFSAFFDIDVASAETVGTSDVGGCGGPATFLQLAWDDQGTAHRVSYRTADDEEMTNAARALDSAFTGSVQRVERVACGPGGFAGTNLVAGSVLGSPSLRCDGGTAGSCAGEDRPRTVGLELQLFSRLLTNQAQDRFSFGITATRRVTP